MKRIMNFKGKRQLKEKSSRVKLRQIRVIKYIHEFTRINGIIIKSFVDTVSRHFASPSLMNVTRMLPPLHINVKV